jgi:hypothetical protein
MEDGMEWQPIETAPKAADILLGAFYNSGHWDVAVGRWQVKRWPYVGQSQPTHWMPLPPAPTRDGEGEQP